MEKFLFANFLTTAEKANCLQLLKDLEGCLKGMKELKNYAELLDLELANYNNIAGIRLAEVQANNLYSLTLGKTKPCSQ